jgi:hypothetical protein
MSARESELPRVIACTPADEIQHRQRIWRAIGVAANSLMPAAAVREEHE